MGDVVPDPAASLHAARAGSREALGALLQACRGYLLGVADRELDSQLLPKAGGSDIVQETFLEAQRDFQQFQGGSEAELLAWLRRLLLNNVANFSRNFRQTGKRQISRELSLNVAADSNPGPLPTLPEPAASDPSPSQHLSACEYQERIERATARLPEEFRQVLALRFQQQHTFEEIGERMGRTTSAARKLWARAVLALQQELEQR